MRPDMESEPGSDKYKNGRMEQLHLKRVDKRPIWCANIPITLSKQIASGTRNHQYSHSHSP